MIPTAEILSGRQYAWSLIKKLGEGDAGEVYLVESLLDRRTAILKRPCSSAFPSDIIRQAAQIEKEGKILSALAHIDRPGRLFRIPQLLDQSKPGYEFSEQLFIVMEKAKGFDLGFLARLILSKSVGLANQQSDDQLSPSSILDQEFNAFEQHYLEALTNYGKIPELLIMRALSGLIDFLEEIHFIHASTPSVDIEYGILWNDVKPDHIFWNPHENNFTIIDWGNGQFLEADGTTKDQMFSRLSDHYQLLTEMGHFLEDTAADLYTRLQWPQSMTPVNAYSAGISPLKERLSKLIRAETVSLNQVRQQETLILQSTEPNYTEYMQLAQTHLQILAFGDIPDYQSAEKYLLSLSNALILDEDLEGFRRLCLQALHYPTLEKEKFQLLDQIARITIKHGLPIKALQLSLDGDWVSCLWDLRVSSLDSTDSDWWREIIGDIRRLGIGSDVLNPYVALNRLIHALHTKLRSLEHAERTTSQEPNRLSIKESLDLLLLLKDEILPRWTEMEPNPPDSGLEYREIERYFDQISEIVPEAGEILIKSLDQPQAQVKMTVDAWEHQDFETARRCLRQVLLWDPDRMRVLTADRAIQAASVWLEQVRGGLKRDEPLQNFITGMELAGREIRNQVAPAVWLDALINAFKQLRRGNEPTDILVKFPKIRSDINWLISLEPLRPLFKSPDEPVLLERKPIPQPQRSTLYGIKEAALGYESGIMLQNPLDTWTPEARGSSARLFAGTLCGLGGETYPVAMKLMRPDRIEYSLPLFREETCILTLLHDIPGVTPLLECGFIHLTEGQQIPPENEHSSAQDLTGSLLRYGLDSTHNFLADLEKQTEEGWLPYLAIAKQAKKDNLLLHCDTGYTQGKFLPILEGLRIGIQVCDILQAAHARNITYRDHKILHYYWKDADNGIFMIDWNIARRYPEGLANSEVQFDLVQFGARTLHYALTGRPAPGALPLGPNRPEEIEAAARSYSTQWTYDDQGLPRDIKELLQAVLAGDYQSAKNLQEDLSAIFMKLSELV